MFAKSALALFMATLATAAIANEPTQDETDKDLERIIITGVKPLNSIELAKIPKRHSNRYRHMMVLII